MVIDVALVRMYFFAVLVAGKGGLEFPNVTDSMGGDET